MQGLRGKRSLSTPHSQRTQPAQGTGEGTGAPEGAHAFKVRDLVEETEVLKESTNSKRISIEVISLSLQISVTYKTLNS